MEKSHLSLEKANFGSRDVTSQQEKKCRRKKNKKKQEVSLGNTSGQGTAQGGSRGFSVLSDAVAGGSRYAALEHYFNQGECKSTTDHRRDLRKKIRSDEENDENEDPTESIALDQDLLCQWFEQSDKLLPADVQEHNMAAKRLFPIWLSYINVGFNLVIYGVGSKRNLMLEFCETMLEDFTYVFVDAFEPSVSAQTIFQCLETNLSLNCSSQNSNLLERAMRIANALERKQQDIVIVLNNIDGPALRTKYEQHALASLVNPLSTVHLIATIDHFNATLLWDREMLKLYNFLYIGVNTKESYKCEVFAGDSKLLGRSTNVASYEHTRESLEVVWLSLTNHSRYLWVLITKRYYPSKKAIEFFQLFREARYDFLVSTDTALRLHLNEFDDHRLIRRERRNDGNEYISLLVDEKLLMEFFRDKEIPLTQ